LAKFPDPPSPSELAKIAPVHRTLRKGVDLCRVHAVGGPFPSAWGEMRFFGPVEARFDHHLPPPSRQSRGILYAALEERTCFAEAFQKARAINRRKHEPWLVRFRLARNVTLLDMTGTWPTRAGASMAIHSGPRARARKWSRAIYEAYPHVEGLWTCSSMHANQHAAALYERALDALPDDPTFHRALADPTLDRMIQQAAKEFGCLVV